MWENIQYEQYKGHDIRSSPIEVQTKKRKGWKVRIDITFPPIYDTTTSQERLDKTQLYLTLDEAHTARLKYGRRMIDESIQKQRPHTLSN